MDMFVSLRGDVPGPWDGLCRWNTSHSLMIVSGCRFHSFRLALHSWSLTRCGPAVVVTCYPACAREEKANVSCRRREWLPLGLPPPRRATKACFCAMSKDHGQQLGPPVIRR